MKLSVYVPDELGEQVRKHKLPIAAICQIALRAAVLRIEEQCQEQNADGADYTSEPKTTTMKTVTSYIVTVTQIR